MSKPITSLLLPTGLLLRLDAPPCVVETLLAPSALYFIPFFKKFLPASSSRLSFKLPTAFMELVFPSVFQMHVTVVRYLVCVAVFLTKSNISF